MRRQRGVAAAWVLLFVAAACSTPPASQDPPKQTTGSEWHDSMRELSRILSRLAPLLYSRSARPDAEQKAELLDLTRRLQGMTHAVSETTSGFGSDPTLKPVSREFRRQVDRAIEHLKADDWNAVKPRLARISQYCIGCHTMMPGEMAVSWKTEVAPDLSKLEETELAEYFAATRQFDQAIIHFEYALNDKAWAKANPKLWDSNFRKLFAITVRVRKNPSLSLEMVSRFIDTGAYPKGLAPFSRSWRSQIKEWREEESRRSFDSLSNDQKLARVIRLIDQADRIQGDGKGKSGFVLYLRASGMLYELLQSSHSGTDRARISYYAGHVAERLEDVNLWTRPTDYYSLCVEEDHLSEWNRRCSERLHALKEAP